jgi:hypothetical protein
MKNFSCYSKNENMATCQKQCEFCQVYFHPLPKLTRRYNISVHGNQDQNNIKVYAPDNLLTQLKELKRKDKRAFNNALIELINDKF